MDGRLIRSAYDTSGETGFILADPALGRDRFIEEGSPESVISGPGIVRRYREALIQVMQAMRARQAIHAA